MLPGDLLELTINDIARSGSGVARAADGQVVFVPFTAPGDRIEAKIESIEKRYAFARLERLLEPSPKRATPPCPVFTQCGGCEWQHLPYELQWQTKAGGLKHALSRVQIQIPGTLEEIPAEQIWEYRNRVQMRGFQKNLGFYGRGTNEIVAVDHCAIARPEINAALTRIRAEGETRTKPYKVELAIDEEGNLLEAWNARHAATGFRQVHDGQNEKLKDWVARQIPDGALLLDLYGGRGNLSLGLCGRLEAVHCVDVGAAESVPEGSPANFSSYQQDVFRWLKNSTTPPKPKSKLIVVMDPPRDGLGPDGPDILDIVTKWGAEKLVFVGCETDSWARDLSRAQRRGWTLTHVAALDLFPQTHHIEALAVMERT